MKIKDFQEHMKLTLPLLVTEMKNGTTNKGSQYVTLTLQDDSGNIEGKYWDISDEVKQTIVVGEVMQVSFEVIMYGKALQLRILGIEQIDQKSISLQQFVQCSLLSLQEKKEQVEQYLHRIQDPIIHLLVEQMILKVEPKFYDASAAAKIHHAYLGGLSDHTLSMIGLALKIGEHYPSLNQDLLIAGCFLHDLGKTCELSGPIATEYTVAGKLQGHISIASGWLSSIAEKHQVMDSEQFILLNHMILSHHGKLEYGSPVMPAVLEAEILWFIDNIDARINTINAALDTIDAGKFTSRLFALDNRQFYKPKLGKE